MTASGSAVSSSGIALLLLAFAFVLASAVRRQPGNRDQARSDPVVLFVCEHGSAKSVVAAAHFERLARLRGRHFRAVARGTEPDPDLSAQTAAGLATDGLDWTGYRPRRLVARDFKGVARVVSFRCDLSDIVPSGLIWERWDDTPAVSEGYGAARDAIVERLGRLLDDLAGAGR
jgi:protein-tyrosine-phosphatase